MINVTRSSMPDFDEYCKEIKELWETRWLTNMGVKHRELENKLKELLGCGGVSLFTNGHLALETAIAAFQFPEGAEVITTPFTFASTTNAIVRNGLVPVFCDIKEDDYTIDPAKIEALITEKTVAVLPVHVYGNMCDTDAIESIAKKYCLKVIYDAAHAFGVKKDGRSSATFGDVSMFSFHATKVFNTIEGGALCFKDEKLGRIYTQLKNFGIESQESVVYAGGNAKMNEFQAAMGICNLRHLDEQIDLRRRAVERYRKNLIGVSGIKLCNPQPGVVSNYAYFPILFDGFRQSRDEVFALLGENEITARKYFYPLTSNFAVYRGKFPVSDTAVASNIAKNILTLPLYAGLEDSDIDRICEIILR